MPDRNQSTFKPDDDPRTTASLSTYRSAHAAALAIAFCAIGFDIDYAHADCTSASPCSQTLVSNLNPFPYALTADTSYVFWVLGGSVMRVPKRGGVVNVVVSGEPHIWNLAATATGLYWTNARNELRTLAPSSTTATTIAHTNADYASRVTPTTFLVWHWDRQNATTDVGVLDVTTGTTSTVASPSDATDLASSATAAFWNSTRGIVSWSYSSRTLSTVTSPMPPASWLNGLAVNGNDIYVLSYVNFGLSVSYASARSGASWTTLASDAV